MDMLRGGELYQKGIQVWTSFPPHANNAPKFSTEKGK